jgi:uncharacterized membrane protein YtjA (UPF0391 family)
MLQKLRLYWFPILLLACAAGIGVIAAVADAGGVDSQAIVTPNRGELGFAGITGTTAGIANTALTTTTPSIVVSFENTTNVELMVTRGNTDFKRLPASSFRVFDLKSNGTGFAAGTWKVYYTGSAPASGNLEVIAIPYR